MKGKPALCYSYTPTQTLQSVQYKGFWLVSVMWFSIYVRFVRVLFCLHHLYSWSLVSTDHTIGFFLCYRLSRSPHPLTFWKSGATGATIPEYVRIHALLGSFKNSDELWEVEPPHHASPDLGISRQARYPLLTAMSPHLHARTHLQNTVATSGLGTYAMMTSACHFAYCIPDNDLYRWNTTELLRMWSCCYARWSKGECISTMNSTRQAVSMVILQCLYIYISVFPFIAAIGVSHLKMSTVGTHS